MKFFLAVKQATFAAKAFAAAGINFETVFAGDDENALKAHIEAAIAGASAKSDPEQEKAIAEALKENERLSSEVATASANAHKLAALIAATGIKLSDCLDEKGEFSAEKFGEAQKPAITKLARQMIATSGHPPIDETPVPDGAKPGAKKEMAREEFTKLPAYQQSQFCLKGGRVTE